MAEWLYKATPTKADFDYTRRLAMRDGFLCRSAHEEKNKTWADRVREPSIGDLLHSYYMDQQCGSRPIGSFEIIGPDSHPNPSRFGAKVDQTAALFCVVDQSFASQLSAAGDYHVDPVLKVFTGWLLKPLGSKPPNFDQTPLQGARATLIKREP